MVRFAASALDGSDDVSNEGSVVFGSYTLTPLLWGISEEVEPIQPHCTWPVLHKGVKQRSGGNRSGLRSRLSDLLRSLLLCGAFLLGHHGFPSVKVAEERLTVAPADTALAKFIVPLPTPASNSVWATPPEVYRRAYPGVPVAAAFVSEVAVKVFVPFAAAA
jgi:hypothetical protein